MPALRAQLASSLGIGARPDLVVRSLYERLGFRVVHEGEHDFEMRLLERER